MKKLSASLIAPLTAVLLIFPTSMFAQGIKELSDEEKKALSEITSKKVLATVSFLASDELAGRGTGTNEFKIAAAFVASRFRGAGLKGGGKEGSFYQFAEIDAWQVSNDNITLSGPKAPKHFGLLTSGSSSVDYSGPIASVDERQKDLKGPVTIVEGQDFRTTMTTVRRLRRNGATAVLVQVAQDSQLIAAAKNAATQITMRKPVGMIPVLLIEKTDFAESDYQLKLPAIKKLKKKVRNVIGVIPGSDPELSKEAIIFSAHLDHLGKRSGPGDQIYNGADDNATGVTGVISLADAYAALKTKPKRTLIFMAFWGEERGLLGSYYFAKKPLWPLEKTVANINLEMIGRPESGARNKTWMTGWGESDLGSLMAIGAKRTGTLVFEHPRFSGRMLYGASDNWPFVQKGVVAHSFSAGSLHRDYHQPSDEWKKLEIDHMTAVIKGLFAGSKPLADGILTPKRKKK